MTRVARMTRIRRAAAIGILAVPALLIGAAVLSPRAAVAEDPAVASFLQIAKVLQSPRCVNCHPTGDYPLQGDDARPHRMKVSRRSEDAGLPCTTCHQRQNAPFLHGPPGVPGWKLPPRDMPMVFQGKTPRELCEQLKDPAQNGHKKLSDLEEHFGHDPIVLWGWNPGPGRKKPPISHEELVGHTKRWLDAGAPCPPLEPLPHRERLGGRPRWGQLRALWTSEGPCSLGPGGGAAARARGSGVAGLASHRRCGRRDPRRRAVARRAGARL